MKTHFGKIISSAAACAILASSLLVANVYAAEYYKWVDDEGVTHFSEIPPVERKAEKLVAKLRPPIVENVPDADEEAESSSSNSATQQSEEEANSGVSYLDPARCKSERVRLKALSSNQRIKLTQPDGSHAYLDKEGIKKEIQKTQKIISMVCE